MLFRSYDGAVPDMKAPQYTVPASDNVTLAVIVVFVDVVVTALISGGIDNDLIHVLMKQRFIDQMKREVEVDVPPKRIISLVPSQTELLFDLGLEDEVVGITRFCIHPRSWYATKTRIGGTKNIHFEKVRSLKPEIGRAHV